MDRDKLLEKWGQLPREVQEDMKFLGHFGPVANGSSVKGSMVDEDGDVGKTYLYPSDLRNLARSCAAVADFLEAARDE